MASRKKVSQKEVVDGYRRLAFGNIESAVKLLYEPDEDVLANLSSYDLFNVSEIKRAKGGGMEIKFFDRLKALERLYDLAQKDEAKLTGSIFDALEKSAQRAGSYGEEDVIE